MTGRDILKSLNERRTNKHQFVRWWRKEEDFLDYDLIDRFIDNSSRDEEIGGIDLLTMDEMWGLVKKIGGTRVKLVHDPKGERIEWLHEGKQGSRKEVCAYTPDTLMKIFDAETHGNPVDS